MSLDIAPGLRRSRERTPWGDVGIVAREDGTVVASWFGPAPRRLRALHDAARHVRRIEDAGQAIAAWVDGDVDAILRVPVEQPGGEFQQGAWQAMRRVGGGTVVSYAELALMAGRPRAVRAAGTACAVNAVAPFVPCHRIVRSDGTLGNYGYGIGIKAALLAHEGVVLEG